MEFSLQSHSSGSGDVVPLMNRKSTIFKLPKALQLLKLETEDTSQQCISHGQFLWLPVVCLKLKEVRLLRNPKWGCEAFFLTEAINLALNCCRFEKMVITQRLCFYVQIMELREEIEETADPTKLQELKEKVCLSGP